MCMFRTTNVCILMPSRRHVVYTACHVLSISWWDSYVRRTQRPWSEVYMHCEIMHQSFIWKFESLTCIIFLSHSLMLCSSFESYQMLSGFSVASAACCEHQVSFFISKWSCHSVSSFQGFCWAGHSQHCLQTKFWTDTGTDVKITRSIITICKVYLLVCSKVGGGVLFK